MVLAGPGPGSINCDLPTSHIRAHLRSHLRVRQWTGCDLWMRFVCGVVHCMETGPVSGGVRMHAVPVWKGGAK